MLKTWTYPSRNWVNYFISSRYSLKEAQCSAWKWWTDSQKTIRPSTTQTRGGSHAWYSKQRILLNATKELKNKGVLKYLEIVGIAIKRLKNFYIRISDPGLVVSKKCSRQEKERWWKKFVCRAES